MITCSISYDQTVGGGSGGGGRNWLISVLSADIAFNGDACVNYLYMFGFLPRPVAFSTNARIRAPVQIDCTFFWKVVVIVATAGIAVHYYSSCSLCDITDVYCTIIIFLMIFAMEHTMKIYYGLLSHAVNKHNGYTYAVYLSPVS